jgi:putative addiction module killer protein
MKVLANSIQLDTIEVYRIEMTQAFASWLGGIQDQRTRLRIVARLRQATAGNFGDWKPIEGALSEMRLKIGPGFRLYFTRRGRVLILMLAGGDKSSQSRDIEKAKRLLEEL